MCSLDYYGIFLGVDAGAYIAAVKPDVQSTVDSSNYF